MRVAVLGGGQLARMLALEGIPLGHRFTFLEPSPDPPAGTLGTVIKAPYDDPEGLARIAADADVVTYEFENVPAGSAAYLAARLPALPPPVALAAAQDRLVEKQMFKDLGIPTAPFHRLDTPADLDAALETTGLPAVIKTRRFGYDGKGQVVARSHAQAAAALAALGPGLISESFINFQRELSILAAGGRDGSRVFYPLTENHHRDGILRLSYAPAPGASPALQEEAERLAGRVMKRLDYVGVLAIELFEADGRLLANEMAPRVHNSGHWTLDGAGPVREPVREPHPRRHRAPPGHPADDGSPLPWSTSSARSRTRPLWPRSPGRICTCTTRPPARAGSSATSMSRGGTTNRTVRDGVENVRALTGKSR